MKVVINRCWGGFSLSNEAMKLCIQRGMHVGLPGVAAGTGCDFKPLDPPLLGDEYEPVRRDNPAFRTNPVLVAVVEELGEKASGNHSRLAVVDIPFDDLEGWYIQDHDGQESVSEYGRSWC